MCLGWFKPYLHSIFPVCIHSQSIIHRSFTLLFRESILVWLFLPLYKGLYVYMIICAQPVFDLMWAHHIYQHHKSECIVTPSVLTELIKPYYAYYTCVRHLVWDTGEKIPVYMYVGENNLAVCLVFKKVKECWYVHKWGRNSICLWCCRGQRRRLNMPVLPYPLLWKT